MSNSTDGKSVTVNEELLIIIKRRVNHTNFDSVEDYVNHVLEEVVHQTQETAELSSEGDVSEDEVKERLRSLGYINQ